MIRLRKVELSERAMWNWDSWWNINVNKHYSLMQMKHLLYKIVKKWQYLKSDQVNGGVHCYRSHQPAGSQSPWFLLNEYEKLRMAVPQFPHLWKGVQLSSAAGLNYAHKLHETIVGNIICTCISMNIISISSVLWIIRKDVKSSGLQV